MKSYPVYIAAAALVTTVATASWQQARAADELTVSVTVTNPCAIGTGSIAFGTISSDSSPAPASGTVTLTNCNGFDTTVTIGDSDNGGSAEFALKADNGDDLITYTMIEDTFFAGGSVAPGSESTISVTSASLDLAFTANLDATDLGDATGDDYSDAVDITISFVPTT